MHRYEELEKIYYKKRYLKIFFIFGFVFLIGFSFFYFIFFNKTKNTKKEKNKKEVIKKEKKINKEINKKNLKIKKEPKKISFILPEISKSYEEKSKKEEVKKEKTTKNKEKAFKKEVKTEKKSDNIKIEEKSISLNELIKKYNLNPSYDIAMIIAKEYFKKGDLENARIWAVKANSLNPEDVDSWLFFADILLKKNEKEKALKILNVYIETYGDNPLIEAKIRSINE